MKSQQIEASNLHITSLRQNIKALSCSLKEKEATAAQLQSELQSSHRLVFSTTEQLLELLKLQPQIAELERKLQEAEYKKQQAVLEKRAVVQVVEARKKLEVQLCAQLGELCDGVRLVAACPLVYLNFVHDIFDCLLLAQPFQKGCANRRQSRMTASVSLIRAQLQIV